MPEDRRQDSARPRRPVLHVYHQQPAARLQNAVDFRQTILFQPAGQVMQHQGMVEEKKLDRRERRTHQLLSEALIALMQEKRYDTITVQDIIDRADVGRSTFYAHYQDKEDLLMTAFQTVLEQLLGQIEEDGQANQIIPGSKLFRHFQEHHHLYHALVRGHGLDTLYRTGRDYLTQIIERRIVQLAGDTRSLVVPLPVLSDYVAGSLLNLAHWWFDNRMPYSPERMDEIFQCLVMPGVWAALSAPGGVSPGRSGTPGSS